MSALATDGSAKLAAEHLLGLAGFTPRRTTRPSTTRSPRSIPWTTLRRDSGARSVSDSQPAYRIISIPAHRVMSPGAIVTYKIELTSPSSPNLNTFFLAWFCIN